MFSVTTDCCTSHQFILVLSFTYLYFVNYPGCQGHAIILLSEVPVEYTFNYIIYRSTSSRSMKINDPCHKLWVCIVKKTGEVKSAYFTCFAESQMFCLFC